MNRTEKFTENKDKILRNKIFKKTIINLSKSSFYDISSNKLSLPFWGQKALN